MNVVFVEVANAWLVRKHAQVPLGPLYLATILQKAGCKTRMFRMNSEDDVYELLDYDVICFSGTTLEYPAVLRCVEVLREISNASLWYGGPHATAMSSSIIEAGLFDSVSVGESEGHIVKMTEDLSSGLLKSTYGPSTVDIDSIPFPNRSLVEGSHGGDIFAYGRNYKGNGHENVITSRGCAWKCAFCSSAVMFPKVQLRSPENVLAEIENIIMKTGCHQIRFADDEMATKSDRLFKICEGLAELKCAWRCSARADCLNTDVCEAMYKGGCREVSVGIESGDQRVLEHLYKKTSVHVIEKGCRDATRAGLKVRGLFMIGTPGERENTPEINRDFIKRVPFDSITLSTFVPLPGSPIWNDPVKYCCRIIPLDFSQYNKDFWISEDGCKTQRETCVTIESDLLSYEQQAFNIDRMKQYVIDSGRCNLG